MGMAGEITRDLDDIADAIEQMAEVGKQIKASRLNERAIVVLIQKACGAGAKGRPISQRVIQQVLDSLEDLPGLFLKDEGE